MSSLSKYIVNSFGSETVPIPISTIPEPIIRRPNQQSTEPGYFYVLSF